MSDVAVGVPEELLEQLARSGLGRLEEDRRVRVALAVHLFLTQEVSVGRAAELAGYPLVQFYDVLQALNLPAAIYGPEELVQDLETIEEMRGEAMKGEDGAGRGR
jgi:predicted HTH domain antitoxin